MKTSCFISAMGLGLIIVGFAGNAQAAKLSQLKAKLNSQLKVSNFVKMM